MKTKAFITGITGQDGSFLARLLLSKGYEVHGLVRRSSSANLWRIADIVGDVTLHSGDLGDAAGLGRIVRAVRPDEVYNLAAQSHVHASFHQPAFTSDVTGTGVVRLLDAVRELQDAGHPVRFYQASSSEMFGGMPGTAPQSEQTPFHPRSPYGCAKAYAHWQTVNYREAYGLHASCGILFNHESPVRGEEFVTRKIARGVAAIFEKRQDVILLGNLDARRDWGFAGDYVKAMWLMLQQDTPDDYVIATGETHSVREFCEVAFDWVLMDYRNHVKTHESFHRPAEVEVLQGDSSKARKKLGWAPEVSFHDLVRGMVDHEVQLIRHPSESGAFR
jgi:GDPmannose 4,6-dehydratase